MNAHRGGLHRGSKGAIRLDPLFPIMSASLGGFIDGHDDTQGTVALLDDTRLVLILDTAEELAEIRPRLLTQQERCGYP